jgi:hypothetical protein
VDLDSGLGVFRETAHLGVCCFLLCVKVSIWNRMFGVFLSHPWMGSVRCMASN